MTLLHTQNKATHRKKLLAKSRGKKKTLEVQYNFPYVSPCMFVLLEFQKKTSTFKADQYVQHVGNRAHLSRLSSGLDQLRQQASFCDVNIIVGDQRFPAHKAVLSSASDYFQGMFSSGFQESAMNEISVPGTEKSFAQILDFAYTGYFMLSLETVTDIFKMACYMVFTEAIEICAEYLRGLKDQLPLGDCLEVWSIARNHSNLSDIAQLYRSHLLQNFPMCAKSVAFLENSSALVMMEFLSDEEIETDTMTEEHILEAVMTWLKFDWDHRKVHAVDLLKKVRLGLVPLDRLRKIFGDDLLAIPECKNMIAEVVKLSVTKETASPPLVTSHPKWFASRNTITATISITEYDEASRMLPLECATDTACYNLVKVPDLPNKLPFMELVDLHDRNMGIIVTDKGNLYAAVGNCLYLADYYYEDDKAEAHMEWLMENNFFRYDSDKNEWILLPPMPTLLCDPKMVYMDEYIYVVGSTKQYGFDSPTMMLRYSIPSKTWTVEAEDLHMHVTDVTVFNGDILIEGVLMAEGPNPPGPNNEVDYLHAYVITKVKLYKPGERRLLNVTIDTLIVKSYFSVHEGICYMVANSKNKTPGKVNRVICDFDGDNPTMVVSEAVHDKTLDLDERSYDSATFSFDKRKVGFELMDCSCDSHVKKKSQEMTQE